MQKTYSFDDVLLMPQYSDVESRSDVSLASELDSNITLELPVIASPMDTVSEEAMALTLDGLGGMAVLHRYNTIGEQTNMAGYAYNPGRPLAAAIGATGDYYNRANALVREGVTVLCIDIAHGHHKFMEVAIKKIKDRYGNKIHVMAGNVATLEAFDALASWGADSIRVGIGGGSICSTRIVTGHGLPTLQSVFDCSRTSYDTKIIADGGIKTTGDMVKALAAGADFVMVGSMLAGTNETPGEVFVDANGEKQKEYRCMASATAQRSWRGKSGTPEGVSTVVPYKGPVGDIIQNISGGIRSGLSYTGVRSIKELQARAKFVLQSGAAQLESNTHIMWRHK